jgi:hypothetical protein
MLVILVLVKEAGDLLLQLRHMTRLSHRSRVLEKAALDVSRKIVPLQDHRRAEASQDVFFFLGQRSLCLLRGVPVRRRSSSLVVPARKLVVRGRPASWTRHHSCEYGTTIMAPPMTSSGSS